MTVKEPRQVGRGVSDISESSELLNEMNDLLDRQDRGGYLDSILDEHKQNVIELRRYQQEDPEWKDENRGEVDTAGVYVIDDADRLLREESLGRISNVSDAPMMTLLPEENNNVSPKVSYAPSMKKQKHVVKDYKGHSKESIMIMQDIDGLAGTLDEIEEESEDSIEGPVKEPVQEPAVVRRSPHSTLLPSVVSMASSHYNSLTSNNSGSDSSQRVSPLMTRRQTFPAHPFTRK